MQPRVLILRAPGTNCEQETAHAFSVAGGIPSIKHLNEVLAQPGLLTQAQVLCIPGGFSFGDDIASGRVFANRLDLRLADALQDFKAQRKLVLGVCNGFQVLMKSRLLQPDVSASQVSAAEPECQGTLHWNESGRYEDRWVHLQVTPTPCVFLRGLHTLYLPVAHAEGRFVPSSAAAFEQLERGGQLPLRYVDRQGNRNPGYPGNPNGAIGDVAGLCDPTGHVFGLMPHPERHIDFTQHPAWTRRETQPTEGDGLAIFRNAVNHFA